MRTGDSTKRERPLALQARDEATLSRLAAIVDNSPDAILLIDLHGTVTDWNRGAERLYGYSALEMIGSSISAIMPLEAGDELDGILGTVQSGQVIGPYDTVRLHKNDGPVFVSLTASPVTDARGAVAGISWIARDITQRKRADNALRDSEAQLTAVYEHNPAGVALSDLVSGRILRVNESFVRILGYSREEALGHTLVELGLVSSVGERERIVDGPLPEHAYTNREMTVHAKGGRPVFILASEWVVELGGRQCIVSAAIDISDRKAAEDALVGADRHKDEFLAMLSHELRNPLAAVSAAVQLMGVRGLDPSSLERARAAAGRQVHHLARILDDLLDVARITRGTIALRMQDVALDDIVQTASDTARPAIEAKKHVLRVSLPREPLRLRADPTRLAQVIANLLDNAAKYTPAGGHLVLSAESDGSGAIVRVRDDGIGMPADLVPHVFDLFVQGARTTARSEGGLGIGLTMVRRMVELHGGWVEARSDGPGKGSEFIVRLSLLPSQARQSEEVEQEAGPFPSHRVLVVDDVADAADLLAMLVEKAGHTARVAYSGLAALEAAAELRPDVVLLDLGMPGVDGYEVARRLREQPDGKGMTIIAVTGYGQAEDRERTRAAGFDQHLLKPVDVDALRRILQQAPAAVGR